MNGEIDGRVVYVKQWSPTKGLENLSKALSMFGSDLAPFIEGDFLMGDIISLLRNDKANVVNLLKEFCVSARIDGKEITIPLFDKEYNGQLIFIFKVFSFVCEVQFKDFFAQGQSIDESRLENLKSNSTTTP